MSEPTPQAHCAKFSNALLPIARHLLGCVAELPAGSRVLDPFAGTGKGVAFLRDVCGYRAVGMELEGEFIDDKDVSCGNALDMAIFRPGEFQAVFTSPTYGNRMADKDMRESVAGTYAKSLGRVASEGSSCHLQWGDAYREFHVAAWTEADRVLMRGGYFLLNIKDHVRGKRLQHVPEWHAGVLGGLGYSLVEAFEVPTPGNRRGANHEARVDHELLVLYRKP